MVLKAVVVDAVCTPQANNLEYPIFAVGALDESRKFYSAYIDLSALEAGYTLSITVGATVSTTGSNKVMLNETFSGVQDTTPLYYLSPLPNWFGLQITLNLTAGTPLPTKNFPYLIIQS